MGTQYSWADTREKAAEAFGGRYPDAELEQELLDVFRERPAFVVDAIADVIGGFQAGRIKSPWPFLRKRIAEAPEDVVVSDGAERERKIRNAEQWLRNVGLYCVSEAEVDDELFGDLGKLRAWAGDETLRARLLGIWRELAPQGAQLERELETRLTNWRATRDRLAQERPAADQDWVGEEPPVVAEARG